MATATNTTHARNNGIARHATPKQLATPTDLSREAVEEISTAVNGLLADTYALYLKTKNFHWHLSGSHFRDYHLMLDDHADALLASTDILAERVRKIGGTTLRSIGHISQIQTIKDDNDEFVSPDQMIERLMNDNRQMAKAQREAHKVCDEHEDVATASILEVLIDETERRTWFLYEICQGGDNTR